MHFMGYENLSMVLALRNDCSHLMVSCLQLRTRLRFVRLVAWSVLSVSPWFSLRPATRRRRAAQPQQQQHWLPSASAHRYTNFPEPCACNHVNPVLSMRTRVFGIISNFIYQRDEQQEITAWEAEVPSWLPSRPRWHANRSHTLLLLWLWCSVVKLKHRLTRGKSIIRSQWERRKAKRGSCGALKGQNNSLAWSFSWA